MIEQLTFFFKKNRRGGKRGRGKANMSEEIRKKLLPPREVAPEFGICTNTLWLWTKKGKIKAERTPTGRFLYSEAEVKRVRKIMEGYNPSHIRGTV